MTVCMMLAAGLLLLADGEGGALGFLAVFFICLFIINFAYSWGPMCWVCEYSNGCPSHFSTRLNDETDASCCQQIPPRYSRWVSSPEHCPSRPAATG